MAIRSSFLFAGILLLACCVSSCVSTGALYKGLTKKKASLEYIYDSDLDADSSVYEVRVLKPVITDPKFTMPGMVRKIKASVIPLIVYTQWKGEYEYKIGSAAIEEDVESFVQSAFVEESNRSGSFAADTALSPGALTLEIEIDSIGAKGPYYSDGFFLFLFVAYSWYDGEKAGPGLAYSRFHYKLRQGDKILMEDFVSSQHSSQPLQVMHKSTKALRNFYNTNLVEALSLTFKANIEMIVEDIDIFLDLEQKKIGRL